MGMCGSQPDHNRGKQIDQQIANDKVTVWGDKFSTETRTILRSLDYCDIPYNFEVIETNLGQLMDD